MLSLQRLPDSVVSACDVAMCRRCVSVVRQNTMHAHQLCAGQLQYLCTAVLQLVQKNSCKGSYSAVHFVQ